MERTNAAIEGTHKWVVVVFVLMIVCVCVCAMCNHHHTQTHNEQSTNDEYMNVFM